MSVRVLVPAHLRTFSGGQDVLEAPAGTARAVMAAVASRHPGLFDRVITEAGELRPHVNLFVGDESVRFLQGLDTPVADGAELAILTAISGG